MTRDPDWLSRYAGKISCAADAVQNLRPGRRILIGSGAAEPVRLVEAMGARAGDPAERLIAEVTPRMPRTHGDSFLHVDKIHRLVPVDAPLLELPVEEGGAEGDAVAREIGQNVATLIPDGATLQTGIGKVPDA